jgi:hypothetical protein
MKILIQYLGNYFYTHILILLFLFYISSRNNSKFLSPATCPSSPWTPGPSNGFVTSSSSNELHHNGDSYSHSRSILNTSFNFNNKYPLDDIDNDTRLQFLPDDLQSSSKDGKINISICSKKHKDFFLLLDLIKFVVALQQHHSTKIAQMSQIHSSALKRLEMQTMQQQNAIDRDSP